ncbi:serine/threonine-protein kinase [Actinomadura scrupuli]|uniref:serine/threonine-protein kinase n=1 Tax=Actinomadura scrupuli TaxID=559629 RepID=UPI003D98DDD8
MSGWRVAGFSELRELGAGAQGRVVLARHDDTGRLVAIKYLFALRGGALTAFREEARMLRRVANPYVAKLYDFVEQPGAGAAILMEAVDGVSLRDMLAERGTLAPEAALAVLKGSLLGLAAAHHVGVVHRDYKPANVMVEGEQASKLVDFGIAVQAGEGSRSGTPAYMAPEQWRAEPATPATDVYAATCVFFECVAGARPYDGADLMVAHTTGPVPVEAVPEPLRGLVARGMAKSPADRPPGAAAFVTELENTAVAAYGPDWETRGWMILGGLAAALAALSPLAGLAAVAGAGAGVAGSVAGSGAAAGAGSGAGAAGSGAGAAGHAGAHATGNTLLGKVAASKVAIAVAGAATVGAVGVSAVVYANSTKPKKPPPVPVAFTVEAFPARSESLGRGATFRITGEYAKVSGLKSRQLTDKVNAALRVPVDKRLAEDRPTLVAIGAGETYTATDKATILLRGPRLMSVRYDTDVKGNVGPLWGLVRTVTVDLTTGDAVPERGLFLPATVTAAGMRTLTRRIDAHLPGGTICAGESLSLFTTATRNLTPKHLDGTSVEMAVGPRALEVFIVGADLGFSSACGVMHAVVPYTEIRELMSPEILRGLATPSPSARP